jgi:hypothetical protein
MSPEPPPPDLKAAIRAPESVSTQADAQTAEQLNQQRYGAQTEGQKQDIQERKKYARLFFYLSCAWLVAIVAIILLQGCRPFSFKLSDSIVLAMIGSTTANVLGILFIVAKYLFPNRGRDD